MTTSLDPGRRVVRVAEGDGAETRDSAWDVSPLSPFFEYIDWFMPNGEELKGIAGAPDVARALESLSPKLNGVVVKLGPEGALTRQGGRTRSHPAAAVPCLDTTCAGDAFDAGFLCGLAKGLSLDESVGLGNHFGALAVSCLGLPDRDGVRALLGDST
jgi:sugar/nucleoside kinase (ribokinase family)